MNTKFCFIDVETTGTDPSKHALIQLAGIIVVDGKEKEKFNYHSQPFEDDIIEDSALAVNKITREQLKLFDIPSQVKRELTTLLGKYIDKYDRNDKYHFIGYNARFDADFVRKLFEKNGDQYFGSWFWFPPIDVMNLAAVDLLKLRNTLPNFKLATVIEKYGIKSEEEKELHDAYTDVRLTQKLFNKLKGE